MTFPHLRGNQIGGLIRDSDKQWLRQEIRNGDWIPLEFENSWGNLSSSWPCFYRKLANGEVQMKGLASGGSTSTVITTLPSGFRPEQQYLFLCPALGGHHRVDVRANGEVFVTTEGTGTPSSWVGLFQIRFDTSGGS